MKLRRVVTASGPEVQVWNGQFWVALASLPLPRERTNGCDEMLGALLLTPQDWEELREPLVAARSAADGKVMLPFEPRSYRDFMLYEQHVTAAARGYVRRFMPRLFPLTRSIEAVTAHPFPAFRPPKLWYAQPIYYMGNHLNFVTEGATIVWPGYTRALDYELELGFVITRPLLNATPQEATEAIGGFVVFNDFSARDAQRAEMASGFGPQKSKHFCNAISSTVVTADEVLPHLGKLAGEVVIDGKTVAHCSDQGARWTLGEALAHVSSDEQLCPGEFFATGTWPNGSGLENGHWLEPGASITLRIDRVGSLTNRVGFSHERAGAEA